MLYVNSSIPAVETLRAEGLDVVVAQPAGVPRIGLLNLMPERWPPNTTIAVCSPKVA